jgi:hypothetical protein
MSIGSSYYIFFLISKKGFIKKVQGAPKYTEIIHRNYQSKVLIIFAEVRL